MTLAQVIGGSALLALVIGAIFGLAWHGTLTGAEAFGAYTSIISIGGTVFGVHAGVKAGAAAASPTTLNVNGPASGGT